MTNGPTHQTRAQIQFEEVPEWEDLSPVIEFLRKKNVRDGDVLAYDAGLVCLYNELDLIPPTRFVYTDVHIRLFKKHREEIRDALRRSPHKYVVSSLFQKNIGHEDLDEVDPATGLPRALSGSYLELYPLTQPVIFRSGWYLVHEVRRPIGPLAFDEQD